MVDYKEILRLSQQYYSLRQIAASVCHSHHTVKNVLDLAAQHGIEWPLDDDMTILTWTMTCANCWKAWFQNIGEVDFNEKNIIS